MPRTLRLPATLVALPLAGCVASAVAMRGMTSMDGPGSAASFLWLWVAMSAAMMLPSVVPAASLAASLAQSSAAFVTGYFALWAGAGVVGFEAARGLTEGGRWIAATAVAVAA